MILNTDIATSDEWHLIKGEHQYGPYTYAAMVQMKQNNLLFDFDFVWSPHMEQWTMVSDLAEFSIDRMSRLIEKSPSSEVFKKRGHERISADLPCLVHDDNRMWKGRIQSLSEGGALVLIENPLFLPGDIITIHARKAGSLQTPFNCTAQILNKRLVKTKIHHDTALHYAVKFLNLTDIGTVEVSRLVAESSPLQKEN
jgi:hypothetical protein